MRKPDAWITSATYLLGVANLYAMLGVIDGIFKGNAFTALLGGAAGVAAILALEWIANEISNNAEIL